MIDRLYICVCINSFLHEDFDIVVMMLSYSGLTAPRIVWRSAQDLM